MISNDREYRGFEMRAEEDGMKVTGYAAVFNAPAVLYEDGNYQYKEQVDRRAFDNALMTDVVMNYNHQGKPVARTKNGTLSLTTDDVGLKISADLSGTEEGRRLFEEIRGGYIDKMSFAFTVSEEAYDNDSHTRTITGVKRLYDVAAVDIPAYDQTSISARDWFTAEAEAQAKAEARREQISRIKSLIGVEENGNEND